VSTATAAAKCLASISELSEAEPFWTEFLRKLAWGGLRGVKLVISDPLMGLDRWWAWTCGLMEPKVPDEWTTEFCGKDRQAIENNDSGG
jgi:hypothetical protein